MNFFIRQHSNLPVLKVQLFKDSRNDFREFANDLLEATISFSMADEITGTYVIVDQPAYLEENVGYPGEYFIVYQFTKKQTKKTGGYIGQFKVKNNQGEIIVPVREILQINITDSFKIGDASASSSCCKVNGGFVPTPKPSETANPDFVTSTPTNTITPSPTMSNTPTNTLTPTQTLTNTPTSTHTPTPTQTPESSPSVTPTQTPTHTSTPTFTPTQTQTPTQTPTYTPTQTRTPTLTPTQTPSTSGPIQPYLGNLRLYYDPSQTASYPGSGPTVFDLSSEGNDGTLSGVTFVNPYFVLNGIDNQIIIPDDPSLEPGSSDWTVEVWINPSVLNNSADVIIGKFDNGGGAQDVSYALRINNANNVYFNIGNGITAVQSTIFSPSINTWYQIIGMYAGGFPRLFVNGGEVGSGPSPIASILNTTNPMYIGSYNNSEFPLSKQLFSGKIGIVRIYQGNLNQSLILQNFNADKSKYGL